MKHWQWLTWMLGMALTCTPLRGGSPTWKPQKPIEFIIQAGPGGGADVMARFIAPLVSKYNLSPQPLVVINKAGGLGPKGFST
jgi:putative tricarboxylic transport membrane protein